MATAPSRKTFPPASIVTTVPLVSKRSTDSLMQPPSAPVRPLLLTLGHQLIVLILGDKSAALDLAAQLAPTTIIFDLGAHDSETARIHNLLDQPVSRRILVVAIL